MDQQEKRIVLSGIRPTAEDQHLGNYLGAIQHFVSLSEDPKNACYFFIADMHALTTAGTTYDAEAIRRGRAAIVLNLLAVGIDPETSVIYTQSAIPEIAELSWILACLSRVHVLEDMHHWAEKKGKLADLGLEANAGLLTYPVLMTADILGPRAQVVPVGKDQRQHVEFARDLARAFNRVTGSTLFPIPDLHENAEITVKSLSDPKEKMGKSDPNGCLFLNDSSESTQQKLMVAVTDPARKRRNDPGNPAICNIYALHEQISQPDVLRWAQSGCLAATIGCRECKERLAEGVNRLLAPVRDRRATLEVDSAERVHEILDDGNRRARARVAETVARAKDLLGLSSAA